MAPSRCFVRAVTAARRGAAGNFLPVLRSVLMLFAFTN